MAKIKTRTLKYGDNYAICFTLAGKEKTLSLDGSYKLRKVEDIKRNVEKVLDAMKTGDKLDRSTQAWLDNMTDNLRERFVRAGLIEDAQRFTLGELWDRYEMHSEQEQRKPNTIRNIEQYRKKFFQFFDESTELEEFTDDEASLYKPALLRSGLAGQSVAGHIKGVKAVFNFAVVWGYIEKSPFRHVTKGKMSNRERYVPVPMDYYRKILEECSTQAWRTILAFIRIGGLRCPSEIRELR